eukprot:TRINITY_DN4164_c0_g1_i3.p1 TRINITY_DN4164_c0_g1~~TRINITY_DN4164_c0_g1_i3.p1  ORF type:complete len:680 (-),score=125.78 TRINITY_DN4164_c0_g1_i3:252-2291(-)
MTAVPDAYDQFGRPAYLHSDMFVRPEPQASSAQIAWEGSASQQFAPRSNDVEMKRIAPSSELGQKSDIVLEYTNLVYNVGEKKILHNVTGKALPGKLSAIMGPSGAGKTTLLHTLSGRRMAGTLQGQVVVNGNEVNVKMMQRISAFVEQLDVLFGSSTPREALLFASKLRLDPKLTDDYLNQKVDSLIEELGLSKCRDSLVGYVGEAAKNSGLKRGLSGGERKRLSIGFELISDPLLIFLDEPTTGLDSFAANSVIRTLRRLSRRQNRTIIFTIHQPSDEIFDLFDYVHALSHGKTIYFGPRQDLIPYFNEIGRPCPPLTIAPDHLIDIVFGDDLVGNRVNLLDMDPNKRDVSKFIEQANDLNQKYLASSVCKKVSSIPPAPFSDLTVVEGRAGKASFLRQYEVLRHRAWLDAIREPRQLRSWVGQTIFLGIFIGLVYLDLGYSQRNVQDRLGFLFFSIILMFVTSFNAPINLFPAERAIFLHEARQGLYDTFPYFLAKLTSEVLQLVFKPILYGICTYWLVNLNDGADHFFIFVFIMFAVSYCVFSLSLMLVAAISNQAVVLALMPIIFIPFIVISGFYVNLDTMPVFITWLQHISFIKYGYRALVRNEFDDVQLICTEEEQRIYECSCPYATGDDVINQLNLDNFPIFADIGIMIGIGAFCDVMACLILDYNARKNM